MNTNVMAADTCECCRAVIASGHACHVYQDGVAISLCGTRCMQDFLLGVRSSGETAEEESLVSRIVAKWRWQTGGR